MIARHSRISSLLCFVLYFCSFLVTIFANHDELLSVVQKAAGVYMHQENHLKSYSSTDHPHPGLALLNQTVVVTGFNYGYSNHLFNFWCFAKKLDIKFIAIAMDSHAHQTVSNMSNIHSYLWKEEAGSSSSSSTVKVEEAATKFRSEQFNIMSMIKIKSVLAIMKLGYHVVFIDPDIAVVRDPVPHMIWDGIDYVHTHNKICPQCYEWDFHKSEEEGNTGMYFVRSNPRTIKLFEIVISDSPKYTNLDDQSIFWLTLRGKINGLQINPQPNCQHIQSSSSDIKSSNIVTTCPLDGCMFNAGALRGVAYDWVKDNIQKRHMPLISLHANYLKGNELKAHALRKHGYWINHYPKHECNEFTPPF